MGRLNLIVVVSVVLVFFSCKGNWKANWYENEISRISGSMKRNYLVENLNQHFPKNVDSIQVVDMLSSFPMNIDSSYNGKQSAFSYLILDTDEDYNNCVTEDFIFRSNYFKDRNTIISHSFNYGKILYGSKCDTFLAGTYPIPYFEFYNFNLGSIEKELMVDDKRFFVHKYNVPKDLEVYVFEALLGANWKINHDVFRPESLGQWKRGCSKGVAISNKESLIVYWFMAW